MKNYYSILGVTPDSTDAEIKRAYRILARKFHPDVNPNGASKFKDISEAYATLSNPKKRRQYDTIHGFFKSAQKQEETYTSSQKAQSEYNKTSNKKEEQKETKRETKKETKKAEKPKQNKKPKDFSLAKQIKKIFNFDGQKKSKPTPKRGSDITEEISLTIKEASEGTERTINVMHTTCCPHCKGRKFINGTMCSECSGTGEKNDYRKITVKIPANVKNGTKLRIHSEGNSGENGGKNGDLYLKIRVEQNSNISYDGNDTVYNVPITPYEAVLGGTISIPSFDGTVSLKLPAKTHSGQKFRLAGQGLKNGDLIVKVYIEIPSYLSDDEIKLYEKLKKMSSGNLRENLSNE